MLKAIILWIGAFAFTSAIDALWHTVLFKKIYLRGLEPFVKRLDQGIAIKPFPALFSQVLVTTCLLALVLYKAGDTASLKTGAIIGALAGVLATSVYGLVNYAFFNGWSLDITLLELIWGPVLGGLSGMFIIWLAGRLNK